MRRSFELDPRTVSITTRADGPGDDHVHRLAATSGQDVERVREVVAHVDATAAAEGLEFHRDVSVPADTVEAHQLLHLAAEHGVQGALEERFARAHFTGGEPLGDDGCGPEGGAV